ncbi:hypothetical protein ABT119_31180 [Streptomyces sp. NPDC001910]|uniref:hypothetical protein n=1 Tax=Streptomyces sp. NPDC001910 TaxID=3154403 RepID=UPI00333032B0
MTTSTDARNRAAHSRQRPWRPDLFEHDDSGRRYGGADIRHQGSKVDETLA